jgi:hypothetical protein
MNFILVTRNIYKIHVYFPSVTRYDRPFPHQIVIIAGQGRHLRPVLAKTCRNLYMRRKQIRTDAGRQAALSQILSFSSEESSREILDEDLRTQTQQVYHQLMTAKDEYQTLKSRHKNLSKDYTGKHKPLVDAIRGFRSALKLRQRNLGQSDAVLAYYKLPFKGKTPVATSRYGWLQLAEWLIKGEATAAAMGYPPMVEPSVAHLTALYEENKAADLAVHEAGLHFIGATTTVKTAREVVDEHLKKVAGFLDYKLRHLKPAERRNILRLFGFKFHGDTRGPQK